MVLCFRSRSSFSRVLTSLTFECVVWFLFQRDLYHKIIIFPRYSRSRALKGFQSRDINKRIFSLSLSASTFLSFWRYRARENLEPPFGAAPDKSGRKWTQGLQRTRGKFPGRGMRPFAGGDASPGAQRFGVLVRASRARAEVLELKIHYLCFCAGPDEYLRSHSVGVSQRGENRRDLRPAFRRH